LVEVGANEALLRVEVAIERRLRETGCADDVLDADRSYACAIEEPRCRLEESGACPRVDRASHRK
jgi:hypothetical protein